MSRPIPHHDARDSEPKPTDAVMEEIGVQKLMITERDAVIGKMVEALQTVTDRYESVGDKEHRKQGVSFGVYTICKRALSDYRGAGKGEK